MCVYEEQTHKYADCYATAYNKVVALKFEAIKLANL